MDNIRLTQFSKSSGCGCKVAPAVLQGILSNTSSADNKNVLVGIESFDDASVIALNDSDCIITTNDFFTPIVDDAYDFGCIAAANAISDVYAMGGRPISAISILGFPVEKISADIVKKIMEGAQDKCREAGISISGGHSIDAPEPFFGLCVTGTITKNHIKRNNSAKAGDSIFLTKPIGTGIFSTALKRGLLDMADYPAFFKNASTLNSIGANLGQWMYVNAMTDITGFGLLGHLVEICEGSGVSAEIQISKVPLLPNLKKYTDAFCVPDNTYRNWNAIEKKIQGITPESFITFNDPQTNGGLLITIDSQHRDSFVLEMQKQPNFQVFEIGMMLPKNDFCVELKA